MTADEWHKIKQVFQAALEIEPPRRQAFLDYECAGLLSLRREVESLLLSHEQDRTFLEVPTAMPAREFLTGAESATWSGRRLGPYKILEEIGEGGMGAVYRAVRADGIYDKQVAIKLMHGGMSTDFFVKRFKNERRILAALEHPNIARLLDGGVADNGTPYVVLEFVAGMPIDEYCLRHGLSIEQRLRLFREVCLAVQYAHRNLVVHRDLKPGNILVTEEGVPKLLDFGIAKILDPQQESTEAGRTLTLMRIMTPDFASPEQVSGGPITTSTDIYSLGVMLYVLLTGRRPYYVNSTAPQEIIKAICETDPEKPSLAVTRRVKPANGARSGSGPAAKVGTRGGVKAEKSYRELAGDLDNIVLKALQKSPDRRYTSVEQFSEDLRRYVEGLPVEARSSSLSYRCGKYIFRHKVGVSAAALVLLSLLLGITLTLRQARIAHANQLRAERRQRQAWELTHSLLVQLPAAMEMGPTPAREMMFEKAVQYLSQLALEERTDPKLTLDLALGYLLLAEENGHPGRANLGDSSGALEDYQRATRLLEKQLVASPQDVRLRCFLARGYTETGLAILGTNVSRAIELYKKALAVLPSEGSSDTRPLGDYEFQTYFDTLELPNPDVERMVTYELLGEQYGDPYFANLGDTSRALENVSKAIAIAKQFYGTNASRDYIYPAYYYRIQLAGILWARGDMKQALESQQLGESFLNASNLPNSSVPRLPTVWSPRGDSQWMQNERAMSMIRRANLLSEAGRLREAQTALRNSRDILEPLFRADAMNAAARRDLTRNYNLSGDVLVRTGAYRDGLKMYLRALKLNREYLVGRPEQSEARHRLADSYEGIGNALAAMGRMPEAIESSRNGVTIRESLAKLDPNDARYKFSLAKNYVSLAQILVKGRRRADALSNYGLALGIQKSMAARDPFNALMARDLASTQRRLRVLNTPSTGLQKIRSATESPSSAN